MNPEQQADLDYQEAQDHLTVKTYARKCWVTACTGTILILAAKLAFLL